MMVSERTVIGLFYLRDMCEEHKTKICSKCKRELPLTSFTRNWLHKDNKSHACKDCSKERNNNIKDGFRRCSKCHEWKPATREYFYPRKDKIASECKQCHKNRHPNKPLPSKPQEGYLICTKCGRELPMTTNYFYRRSANECGFKWVCKECEGHKFSHNKRKFVVDGKKQCTVCKQWLPLSRYYFKKGSNQIGYTSRCKECDGVSYGIRLRKKPKAKDGYRVCLRCGEEKPSAIEYFSRNTGGSDFRHTCRACERIDSKRRLENNVMRRINKNVGNRIRLILKGKKSKVSEYYLGCTSEFYRGYLESLFLDGMSWGNYGNKDGCWTIDHIKPVSCFNLTDKEDTLKAFHFSNTQPLWADENSKKNSLYEGKRHYYNVT